MYDLKRTPEACLGVGVYWHYFSLVSFSWGKLTLQSCYAIFEALHLKKPFRVAGLVVLGKKRSRDDGSSRSGGGG